MKVRLMHPDHDFDVEAPLPAQAATVRQDLALDTLLEAMADGDELILSVAATALLSRADSDTASIGHRQAVIKDVLAQPDAVRQMYALTVAALDEKRHSYWGMIGSHPSSILYSSRRVLGLFMDKLCALRDVAAGHAGNVDSTGFRDLFEMLQSEFDDTYLAHVAAQLGELSGDNGALLSARLGLHGESNALTLRRPLEASKHWFTRLLERGPTSLVVRIAQRDQIGAKTLGEMRDRGISDVANILAQSVDHIQKFLELLRAELAFFVGCLNLHERLTTAGVATCFPEARTCNHPGFDAHDLRDAALVLITDAAVIGNNIDANNKRLVVVTGPNQGGKSTFLRSLGLAQLMLHAGMFVTAGAFSSTLCTDVFTHYKREEDETMTRGKLDEELARTSAIADTIRPDALLLCNESFAATDEREGSELARQVTTALLKRHIRVVFVTHLYTFAHDMFEQHRDDALFLRAQRRDDGTRTFRLIQAPPLETSFGEDLYREIFSRDELSTAVSKPPQHPVHGTQPES